MAMAFAPTAALSQGIIIRNAEVVSKSYPGYWDDLRTAGFRVIDVKDLQPKE
jgi:3-phosphoshikimate 1-carboxyvinyltransferase